MVALLFAVLALVLLTATLAVSAIGTRRPVSFLLGVYVVAWTEAIALALVLSPVHGFERTGLVAGSVLAFALSAVAWVSTGHRRPPAFRPALRRLRTELADPVLAILGVTVTLVTGYAVVLGVVIPQNEWDSLTYHLTRAAFWIQQGAVAYVPHVADVRINGSPPNAEIGQAWTMLLAGSDRYVWLPEMAAVPASMLAVLGIGRRAGLRAREALFGALVFACLPLVVLQSSTAMNDLVVASFFATATYFAIGRSRAGALGAALALGLGFGTKIAAPLLLPVYLVVVLVARRRRALEQCAILIAGVALGSFWYGANLVHTGSLDGGVATATGQTGGHGPALVATRAYRLFLDLIELPGAPFGRDLALIPFAAALLGIAATVAILRGRRREGSALAIGGLIVFVTPLLLISVGLGLSWTWRTGWRVLGSDHLAGQIKPFVLSTFSDSSATRYGPIGVLLLVGGVILALRAGGSPRALRVALAAAPLAFLVVLAVAVPWDPWRARFFLFPIALAAAVWGLAHRYRSLAWAAVGLTVVTAVLVLANSYTKPPGVRWLATDAPTSVFGKPRSRVQTWVRRDGTDEVVGYFERQVPPDATVGLSLRLNDYVYPYFGAHLGRTVHFIARGDSAAEGDSWIVAAPGREVRRCAAAWETALETANGFRVLRRTSGDTC